MSLNDSYGLVVLAGLANVLMIWGPGLVLGRGTGLRGWPLAAAAPLLGYAVAGLCGPLTTWLGIPWGTWTYCGSTLVLTVLAYLLRRVWRGRDEPLGGAARWQRRDQWIAIAGVAIASVAGAVIIALGTGGLTHLPQDWDAPFHANGIRYIADTGDGSFTGMGMINWYETGGTFYPNAYHLVAATVYDLTGAPVNIVMNAQMALLPAMLALAMVALLHRFRVRALTCSFTVLVAVSSVSVIYDQLWRGPLTPFEIASILSLVFVLLAVMLLDERRIGIGAALVLAAIGLLTLQPSGLFTGVLYLLPILLGRWLRTPRRTWRELGLLAIAGVASIVISLPFISGLLGNAAEAPGITWDKHFPFSQSLGSLLTYQFLSAHPQIWLAIPLWIGLIRFRKLRGARWILGGSLIFACLFILTMSYNGSALVVALSRPWWNDQYRLLALAVLPLSLVAGHGLTETGTAIAALLRKVNALRRAAFAIAFSVVFLAFFVLTKGFYHSVNAAAIAFRYGNGPTVTNLEYRAMEHLRSIVRPNEKVMNDRYDGSAWMYAISGAHPVAGHFGDNQVGAAPSLLMDHFDEYDTDARVRSAVRQLNVKYLMVEKGFVRDTNQRAHGLRHLDRVRELHPIYRNRDAIIYRVEDGRHGT
ncbi:DUF6541 family protein [Sciscionella sediminilitoris]|uniref:DUF6541 family protein n=1 Tax=Sciscionella sediminilitoris TaxID=1445613 RepID=UPI0004DF6819|nr:DUF6541 family protein [Sciscionella sp. SE31]